MFGGGGGGGGGGDGGDITLAGYPSADPAADPAAGTTTVPPSQAGDKRSRVDAEPAKPARVASLLVSLHSRADRTLFQGSVADALRNARWRKAPDTERHTREMALQGEFGLGFGAVAALRERELERAREVGDSALADLANLKELADKVVQLTRRYSQQVNLGAQGVGEGEGGELEALMQGLGVANPVTQQTAGGSFHQALARQVAQFVEPLLADMGGMMQLADVYCLYNRARGTDLVSPDDLLQACRRMERLGLSMSLHTVQTRRVRGRHSVGIRVLRSNLFREDEVVRRIRAMLDDAATPHLTVVHLSKQWKVPLALAQQYMALAENSGVVCRDESLQGIRYFATPAAWLSA